MFKKSCEINFLKEFSDFFISYDFSSDVANTKCEDKNEHCAAWQKSGECETNAVWMKANCCVSCGETTVNASTPPPPEPAPEAAERKCEDTSEHCVDWQKSGECETNSVWMKANCCLSCQKTAANAAETSVDDIYMLY